MSETKLRTPRCPRCGSEPSMVIGPRQVVCDAEGCDVLMWNPSLGPEQLGNPQVVDLSGN